MKISKTTSLLFLIFFLALALRILAAGWVDVGTDEMIYTIIPLNIIDAGRLGTVEQSPLFFYLTDLGYTFTGGLGPISSRLPSIIFGSFAVFLIFALALELFGSSKAALFSALLYALSGYVIQFNTEMDMTAFFFALLSMYFFIRVLRGDLRKLYLSAAAFALAVLTKNLVLLFVPGYVFVFLYHFWKGKTLFCQNEPGANSEGNLKISNKKFFGIAFLSILLFLVMLFPIFAYNYLTYTEKGITDQYLSGFLGVGESVDASLELKPWAFSRAAGVIKELLYTMLRWEGVLLLFGLLGITLAFRKKSLRMETALFLLSLLFLVGFIAGKTASGTHFLWVSITLSVFSGYAISWTEGKIKRTFFFRHGLLLIILATIIINVFFLSGVFERKSSASTVPLWKFVHEHIPPEALVVIDPVIYRGIHAWAFSDRHYLEGTYFPALMERLQAIPPQEKEPFPFFFITCDGLYSNCGWKPEDLERIMPFSNELQQALLPQLESVGELKTEHHFLMYKGTYALPPALLEAVDQTHVFWFYPVGWKYPEQAVDTVHPEGFGKLISSLGFLILYGEILLALGSLFLVLSIISKNSPSEQKPEKTLDS